MRKQPIIALYFESENELKFYNRDARPRGYQTFSYSTQLSMKFILLINVKILIKCMLMKNKYYCCFKTFRCCIFLASKCKNANNCFMLSSTEHGIYSAHKCLNANKC